MEVYIEELRLVTEELESIHTQISDLLDRQTTLKGKRAELEEILKQTTSKDESISDEDWEKKDFAWSKDLEESLKSVFNIQTLRPLQLKTMNVTMSKKDCLLIMPTGGGKSLCFQLPALVSKGITLVVSPLVSLMEDQLMALTKLGVKAAMLSASVPAAEVKEVQEAMLDNKAPLKILYVTPEKLAKSKRFMAKLEKMFELGRFTRLVIDEVHCCSQWGHDFRPDYKFLGIMKRQFPGVPILGLTATATLSVLRDVQTMLNISPTSCYLFKASFNRSNLYYEVRQKPATNEKTLDDIVSLIRKDFKGKAGIIYCFSKKEAEDIYPELNRRGITAGVYHADCTPKDRSKTHQLWFANKIQVIVATIAFGMGIDKPDVRYVIHHSISKSMENLYQESGRAGRDEGASRCIVYYRLADVFRQSSMVFTEQTGLDNLMGIVEYCTDSTRCRRSMIARHFGEVWENSDCNEMCDHCDSKRKEELDRVNITDLCVDVITILDHAASQSQRLTAIKVMDSWQGKGAKPMRNTGAAVTCLAREECELILSTMLQQAYIKEDFHFTPYSTISYLVTGSKAASLRHGSAEIHLTVPKTYFDGAARVQAKSALTTQTKKSTITKSSSSAQKKKPKPVVVNPEKSHFTSQVMIKVGKKPKKMTELECITVSDNDVIDDSHLTKKVEHDHDQKVMINVGKKPKKMTKLECITVSDNDVIDDSHLTKKVELKRKALIDDTKELSHLDFCDYLAGSPPNTPTIAEDCQMVSPKKRKP